MFDIDLYANLRELAQGTFPKRCNNCGARYETVEDFVRATKNIQPSASGLKQGRDEDGSAIIELFRNCVCGSTLMDVFFSRRDTSETGAKGRENFDRLLRQLVASGVEVGRARTEILKWLRGQDGGLMNLIDRAEMIIPVQRKH